MGVFPEVTDPLRVEILQRLAKHLPDDMKVEPGLWGFLWLGDLDMVKTLAERLIDTPPPLCSKQFARTQCGRKRSGQVMKKEETPAEAADDESRKRKLEADITQLQPSKIPRPAAGITARVPPCEQSRSPSLEKLPAPPATGRPVGLTPTTSTISPPSTHLPFPPECSKSTEDRVYQRAAAAAAEKCCQRDRDMCLTTRGADCNQIRPIYPFSALGMEDRQMTEKDFWLDQNRFAFKDIATPPSRRTGYLDSTARGTRLFDCASQRWIRSGDVLTSTTDDPETMPLLSIEILHLQWCVNRVISLSAAADVTDEELDPEDPISEEEGEEEEEDGSQETGDLQVGTAASSAAEVPQAEGKGSEDAIKKRT
ncbi:hypothetical protein HK57_00544 [Aspergillus ustus]|uniref:HNH nuclease domain-containing protein n=1 Tax=Aspergillus ustus TaxID=40382 RepID=A0A0C1E6F9_ASPUT|nr:hypothetical protein HK57_00544 [Aspergillus ustus]